jgi:hypothetical protein
LTTGFAAGAPHFGNLAFVTGALHPSSPPRMLKGILDDRVQVLMRHLFI